MSLKDETILLHQVYELTWHHENQFIYRVGIGVEQKMQKNEIRMEIHFALSGENDNFEQFPHRGRSRERNWKFRYLPSKSSLRDYDSKKCKK